MGQRRRRVVHQARVASIRRSEKGLDRTCVQGQGARCSRSGFVPSTAVEVVLDVAGLLANRKGYVRLTTTGQPTTTTALSLLARRAVTGLGVVPLLKGPLVVSVYRATPSAQKARRRRSTAGRPSGSYTWW